MNGSDRMSFLPLTHVGGSTGRFIKTKSMKKTILLTFVLALLVTLYQPSLAKAWASYFTVNKSATATSTVSYMTGGTATTTYNLNGGLNTLMADVDQSNVFIQFTASTSASTLQWQVQRSNDGIDWFDEDATVAITSASNVVVHASSSLNSWTPSNTTASTSRKVITISRVASYYARLVFSIPPGSTGGAIWTQDTEKRDASGN